MFSLDTVNSNFPTFAPKPASSSELWQYTKNPINTGSSVLGIKYNGGVALAADTLTSYGSMARFKDVPRVLKVNSKTIVGAGGDYADFQYVQDMISQRVIEDECIDDGFVMKPRALYNWLTGTLYKRRSKFDPLWNNFVVAGVDNGEPFLGAVNKLGAAYQDAIIATGFGTHLALPLMRKGVEEAESHGGIGEQEAVELLQKSLEVLFYRDAQSWPSYHIGIVDGNGVRILGPLKIQSNWDVAAYIHGYE